MSVVLHAATQDLLVEGPLTNLKPSMIALSQPKRKFDRAAFGVGGVGMGGVGAIGRYHPPDKVGDPMPGFAAGAAVGGAAAPGQVGKGDARHNAGAAAAAALNGLGGAAAAAGGAGSGAADGGFGLGDRPLFSPFAGPSYSIPTGGFESSRPGRMSSHLSSRPSSGSQLGFNTQPDFGLGPGSSQSSFGLGGLMGFGDGLGPGLTGLLGSQPGMQTQVGVGNFGSTGGTGSAGGAGLLPDTQVLSQAGFGFSAGTDDYGASLGLGAVEGVLSQAGFTQAQLGDLLGPSTQPGNKFGG